MQQEVLPYTLINPSCSLKHDTDLQAVAVRVSAKKTLTVRNVYLPPSLDVHFSDLEHLIEQLSAPFVLVGDVNAHSPLWG